MPCGPSANAQEPEQAEPALKGRPTNRIEVQRSPEDIHRPRREYLGWAMAEPGYLLHSIPSSCAIIGDTRQEPRELRCGQPPGGYHRFMFTLHKDVEGVEGSDGRRAAEGTGVGSMSEG